MTIGRLREVRRCMRGEFLDGFVILGGGQYAWIAAARRRWSIVGGLRFKSGSALPHSTRHLRVGRVMGVAVLPSKVYADGNYWTTTSRKDHAVSDFDEGGRGRQGRAG